ncbi:MAG: tetraacyldisaccharide 4'-kinase [bacterium]
MSIKNLSIWQRRLRFLLLPLAWLYGGIVFLRNRAYDSGILRIHRLPVKVISVGNLSAGGSGKTPITMNLAQLCQKSLRLKPAILSRGYGRSSRGYQLISGGKKPLCDWRTSGDEPQLMARRLSGIPIAADADRVRGGHLLVGEFHPDLILLDDGFQHRRLHRDLDVVLLDVRSDVDKVTLLPAGLLREPPASLQRAHLVVLTHFEPDSSTHREVWERFKAQFGEERMLACRLRPSGCRELSSGKAFSLPALKRKRLLAFCGIAKPEAFAETLTGLGADLKQMIAFPDHHRYRTSDVELLANALASTKSSYLITTEKDAVKLDDLFKALPILVLHVDVEWIRGGANVERAIKRLFNKE